MTQPQVIIERPPPPKPEDIKASYGFVTALVKAVPEIGRLLDQAVKGQWTADRFQKALANTSWWKKTPAAQREWLVQKTADPATAAQEARMGGAEMMTIAADLGLGGLTQAEAEGLWVYARMNGYQEEMIPGLIARSIRKNEGAVTTGSGNFAMVAQKMRELAGAYGYSAPDLDKQINNAVWDAFGANQTDDVSGWQTKMINYAATKYAPFAEQIRQGQTVRDIAQPYIDTYAQVLEVPPDGINLADQKLQKWLQGVGSDGKPTAVWQAAQELRQDPRWATTRNARDAAAKTAMEIGRRFGFIG